MLVIEPEAGNDLMSDQAGAKACLGIVRNASVEDQLHVLGATQVEIVAQHLLEKEPARERSIEHLGPRELGLLDEQLVAVTGGAILGGKWMRQALRPFLPEGADRRGRQAGGDFLKPLRAGAAGNAIVERFEGNAFLGQLPF